MPVTTYMFSFWSKVPLLDHAYAPLEAGSSFADPGASGSFKGGLGLLQVVRYHETPVGPYDELVVVPGAFEIPGLKDRRGRRPQMPRCTRIYVSQTATQWNGRNAWNIPKHLARFEFDEDTSGTRVTVRIFPPAPDAAPFFEAELSKVGYVPPFPFSTNVARLVGVDQRLCQPPLPDASEGQELMAEGEDREALCGTKTWRACMPEVGGVARLAWIDLRLPRPGLAIPPDQGGRERDPLLSGRRDAAWWPLYQPWKVGLWIERGHISFEETEVDGLADL